MSKLSLLGVALVSALVVGCVGSAKTEGPPDASPGSAAQPDPSASESSRTTPDPVLLPGRLNRCGGQPKRVRREKIRQFTLDQQPRVRLPAVTMGQGRTVVIFLHQTDGDGLCGWLGFASRVTDQPGRAALMFDLCGYGAATCRDRGFRDDQTAQVDLAVRFARQRMNAARVVLVGASMGGSVAVLSAADGMAIDSFVDLSGPVEWLGSDLLKASRRAQVPGLFAMGRTDGTVAFRTTKAMAAAAPAGSRFEGAPYGHGYELVEDGFGVLQPVGTEVLRWIAKQP